ncbi:hypothetical protein [Streptomyces tsukubensis]|uniref:hypothetical protein n=1 Tax=Streptomyces tsukubensis TaxID=83656 RepID=UPI00344C433D
MTPSNQPDPGSLDRTSSRGVLADETGLVRQGPAFARDLVASLDTAGRTVAGLFALVPGSAVTVSAHTAVVCSGRTAADALQAAADLTRDAAANLTPRSLHLSHDPGAADTPGSWEVTVTLTASAGRDER